MQSTQVKAIITGGVSGLGYAVAERLVRDGGKVALFDVNEDKGTNAVAELGADKARFFRTDVTDEAGFSTVAQLGGHSIKVGAGPTLATHRCDTPAALLTWLETALAQQPQGAGADTPASGRTTA